jgi:esterase/lipase superfamily enzyme
VQIHFATNRNVKRESETQATFGDTFNADGPQFFRVGVAEVVLKDGADPTADDAFALEAVNLYREKPSARSRPRPRSGDLFEQLRRKLKDEEQDVLIYLHGFANTFDSAMQRAAALQTLYNLRGAGGADPLVFAFAWPANGRTFPRTQYFSDRDDARMSGLAMARALLALLRFMASVFEEDREAIREAREREEVPKAETLKRCSGRMHLLAHSMGNWALRHAVLRITEELRTRPLPRLFKNAFLMAADEDDDALGDPNKLGLLFDLCQNVHVYHSENDRALVISDVTKNNPDRLGADGPRDLTALPPRAYAIDCSRVDWTTLEHGRHQYYRIRGEVIDDVKAVLRGTAPGEIANREPIIPGRSWRIGER